MKIFLLLLFTSIATTGHGQFAIINDKYGYVNIRSSPENGKNIVDSLYNGQIVWAFEPEGNWRVVDYQKKGKSITGYIYKDRVKYLASFDSIPIHKLDKRQVVLKRDSLVVIIREEDFIEKNSLLQYDTSNEEKYVSKINGKQPWGTDGNIPKRKYKSITVQIGKKPVAIPKKELENLFEPNLNYSECYYDGQNEVLYLSALNSDGAGGYAVLWIIEKGKYKNKIVTTPF